jgi:hypothetical protein
VRVRFLSSIDYLEASGRHLYKRKPIDLEPTPLYRKILQKETGCLRNVEDADQFHPHPAPLQARAKYSYPYRYITYQIKPHLNRIRWRHISCKLQPGVAQQL